MKTLITIACMLAAQIAYAGSADRVLDCQSASGRTVVKGVVPGDSLDLNLSFEIDGEKLEYMDTYVGLNHVQNAEIQLLGSLTAKKPSFHFVIQHLIDGLSFTFMALPGSVKVKQTNLGETGTFKALVVGTDPRSAHQAVSPTIEVTCDYDYQI